MLGPTIVVGMSVASERNPHCRGEARPEGPKLEARRAEPGVKLLGRGGKTPPHQLGVWGLGERCKLPQWPPIVLVHFGFFR